MGSDKGRRKFHVLYNEDFMDLFHSTAEPLEERHVHAMVDEVADGGADLLLINPNAQRTNYPSKVWQPFWEGYAEGDVSFFGETSPANIEHSKHWLGQMKRLAESGCDYLASALVRCRQKGITPGVSIRMNDVHFSPWKGSQLTSSFFRNHPEWRLEPSPPRWAGATALNYEVPEVRAHFLALIREVVEEYDCEVIELDFLRSPYYFPPGNPQAMAETMNAFLQEVRKILRGTGKPVELLCRIAAGVAPALAQGFDVRSWAKEGLVDGIVTGAYRGTQWQTPVADFREVVGDGMGIYACADAVVDRRDGLPMRRLPNDPEFLRGFAAGHLAAGADGIDLFNFFLTKEPAAGTIDPDKDAAGVRPPSFETLGQLGSLESLWGLPKSYTIMSGWMVVDLDGTIQVPAQIGKNETRKFEMLVAEEPVHLEVDISILLATPPDATPVALALSLNRTPIESPMVSACPENPAFTIATFHTTASALRHGTNQLHLQNHADPVTVQSIDLRVNGLNDIG